MNCLNVNLSGLKLENPVIMSSGILGYSIDVMKNAIEKGAGAVVTKSVGLKPREGYSNPTLVQVNCGLINAMGLPNPGIQVFTKEIRKAKNSFAAPLIVSVYGFSSEEYSEVAKKASDAGADAIELNVSCPNVKISGEIGQNPKILAEVVGDVKDKVNKPVFVKLSPNVTDIVVIAKAAVDGGADALTCINTLKAMAIDVDMAMPILSNKFGGLSGPAIKPIALRFIYELFEQVKVPLIGCGGITNWRDAIEFFLAGASAVQVGTAIAIKDLKVFKEITNGITDYLRRKNHRSLKEIIGLSHRNQIS